MKKIYHLTIDACINETMNNLRVHYEDKDKALAEMNKWKETFRRSLSIPESSNEDWDIDDRGDNVRFRTSCKSNHEQSVLVSLNIYEDILMEDGEEIALLPGMVFKYTEAPNIYCMNKDPMIKGKNEVTLYEPIDMAKRERCSHPESAKSIEQVSAEEMEKYYIIKNELITGKKRPL